MTLEIDRVAEDGVTRLLDLDASSKIQILSAPIQLPGVCGLCGSSRTDDRQYVDLGLWFEFYGQFYFCTFCMTEMTNRLGGLTPEQADALKEENERLRQTILDFQVEKAAVDGAINTLRATGLFDDSSLNSVIVPDSIIPEEDAAGSAGESKNDELGSSDSSKDTTESSSKQRPNDVPSFGNDEFDFNL